MEENRNHQSERISKLVEAINALPANLPNVLCWAIENYSTLEEMAKKSEDILAKIEQGRYSVKISVLLGLKKIYKVNTFDEFFTGLHL